MRCRIVRGDGGYLEARVAAAMCPLRVQCYAVHRRFSPRHENGEESAMQKSRSHGQVENRGFEAVSAVASCVHGGGKPSRRRNAAGRNSLLPRRSERA